MFDAKRRVRLCRLLAVLLALSFAVSIYYAFELLVNRQCQLHDHWSHRNPHQSSYHGAHDAFHSVADRVSVINTVLRGHQPVPLSSGTSPGAVEYFAGSPSASAAVLANVPSGYKRAVTEREALVFLDLLLTLDHVTRRNNITCYMNYGTLLGSFRHHAMIPWDDDADVAMPYADKAQVWALLNEIASSEPNILSSGGGRSDRNAGGADSGVRGGYTVNITADTQFRFTGRESRQHSPSWPWRWPYVDIDFYFENSTHIWLYNSGAVYRYHRDAVFPLHTRPLGPISLYAPRDTRRYLSETFPDYDACSTGMQHKLGQERLVESRACETLDRAYPFVHRSLTWNNVVWETLKLGNASMYSMVVNEPPSSARVSPFTLKASV